ncbi:hypothetical protein PSPO01_12919 [Paraphaeosphaeria sporulosa]
MLVLYFESQICWTAQPPINSQSFSPIVRAALKSRRLVTFHASTPRTRGCRGATQGHKIATTPDVARAKKGLAFKRQKDQVDALEAVKAFYEERFGSFEELVESQREGAEGTIDMTEETEEQENDIDDLEYGHVDLDVDFGKEDIDEFDDEGRSWPQGANVSTE